MTSCKKGVFLFFDTSTLSITHRFVTEGVGGGSKKGQMCVTLFMNDPIGISIPPYRTLCMSIAHMLEVVLLPTRMAHLSVKIFRCVVLFRMLQQHIRKVFLGITLGIQIMDKVGHYDGKSVSNCRMFGTQAMI